MRVLINYKFTEKKLKLTQNVKITDTFFNLPFVLYLTLYSVDTFLSLLLLLLLLLLILLLLLLLLLLSSSRNLA